MREHKSLPNNTRLATIDDFIVNGVRKIGMRFILQSFITDNYEEYTVSDTLLRTDVLPFIDRGRCFVYELT